ARAGQRTSPRPSSSSSTTILSLAPACPSMVAGPSSPRTRSEGGSHHGRRGYVPDNLSRLPALRSGGRRAVRDPRRGPGRCGSPRGLPRFPPAHPARHGRPVAAAGEKVDARATREGPDMTRHHRRWHLWLWLLLTPILAVGLAAALLARPKPVEEGTDVP